MTMKKEPDLNSQGRLVIECRNFLTTTSQKLQYASHSPPPKGKTSTESAVTEKADVPTLFK